jgi:hypothetical protein
MVLVNIFINIWFWSIFTKLMILVKFITDMVNICIFVIFIRILVIIVHKYMDFGQVHKISGSGQINSNIHIIYIIQYDDGNNCNKYFHYLSTIFIWAFHL